MPLCNICKFQVIDISLSVCPNCGAPLQNQENADESADTVSTGTPHSSPPETSDEARAGQTAPIRYDNPDDNLEICDPGELLYATETEPVPPAREISSERPEAARPPAVAEGKEPGSSTTETTQDNHSKIQKLSPEQVDSIRSDMLNGQVDSEYVSAADASFLIHDLSKAKGEPDLDRHDATPPDSEKDSSPALSSTAPARHAETSLQPQPIITPKSMPARRVAYYHKNFIQLTGSVYPHTGDELVIDDRHFILKPKRIKKQYTIGAFALLLVVVFYFVGKQFISPTLPGSGSLMGIVVDDSGRPIFTGVEVSLPEIGRKVVSDPTGFFRFDQVPTGVYSIRSIRPDRVTVSDNISVAANEMTTLVLGGKTGSLPEPSALSSAVELSAEDTPSRTVAMETTPPAKKTSDATAAKSGTEFAALKLKANVDDAQIAIDGKTLGAGNMTYKKLKPGQRVVTVTKAGYSDWTTTVWLKSNETYALTAVLEPAENETAGSLTASGEQLYQSGRALLSQGKKDEAIRDLTEAIAVQPSLADAYSARADAYIAAGKTKLAEDDYIRAGEIYVTQKRNESALEAFTQAIGINKKSVVAYIDRGDLYRRMEMKDKAIEDFRAALKHDENSFRANFELGKMYFASGNNGDADKRLRKAQEINPGAPDVYHYIMLNYLARDDFGKVKKTYTAFKANVSPDDVQAFKDDPKFDAVLRVVGEYEQP